MHRVPLLLLLMAGVASAAIQICPAGQYATSTSTTICSNCEAGKYSNTAGARITCGSCAVGSFCPTGFNTSTCPLGTRCASLNTFAPTPCPAGSYCPTLATQYPCTPGRYCPAGSRAQMPCPPGYYCPNTNTTGIPCDPCVSNVCRSPAIGGNITTDVPGSNVHSFKTSGQLTFLVDTVATVLVVGSGGAGGPELSYPLIGGGGGGGGAVIFYQSYIFKAGVHAVGVGSAARVSCAPRYGYGATDTSIYSINATQVLTEFVAISGGSANTAGGAACSGGSGGGGVPKPRINLQSGVRHDHLYCSWCCRLGPIQLAKCLWQSWERALSKRSHSLY
jgi:hypothetical protein